MEPDPAPRLPASAAERRTVVIVGCVIAVLLTVELAMPFTTAKLGFVFVVLAWAPLLVVHELGHAVAARLVGWHVSEVVIGYGRELFRFQVGPTRVRVHLAPVEGYILPSPTDLKAPRWKSAFIYAAGPGAEAALLPLLWVASGGALLTRSGDPFVLFLQGTGVAIAIGLFFNLLPLPLADGVTDGLGMVLSLTLRDGHFRARLLAPTVREAKLQLALGEPRQALDRLDRSRAGAVDADPRLDAIAAVALTALGRADDAEAALDRARQQLTGDPDGGRVQGDVDTCRAWVMLLGDNPEALVMARMVAASAVEATGGDLVARVVLGRLELARGDARTAYRHFMASYKQARIAEEEAICLSDLAVAAYRATGAGRDDAPGSPVIARDYAARFAAALERCPIGDAVKARVRRELAGTHARG